MTTTQNLARPWGLLEPDAWKAGTSGSEGAGAQQCAPATRRFHIQWRRKSGTNKWYVYTFIADRPVKAIKAKMRALTHRTSLADLGATLTRLNQIQRGWANYFRHAVATHTFKHLQRFLWWRIVRWLKTLHRWRWTALRRHLTDHNGRWKPISADGVTLFNLEKVGITRYRYRGAAVPNPWNDQLQPR